KLISIIVGNDSGRKIIENLTVSFKKIYPNVPNEFWDQFQKEFDSNELYAKLIPVYDKYFELEDIEELIKFYDTPTGKKFIKNLPEITNDCFTIGQAYGAEIAKR